jgi:hypothetical protein
LAYSPHRIEIRSDIQEKEERPRRWAEIRSNIEEKEKRDQRRFDNGWESEKEQRRVEIRSDQTHQGRGTVAWMVVLQLFNTNRQTVAGCHRVSWLAF